MPPVLDVQGLVKSYRGAHVLNGVDLRLQGGEMLAVTGKSGSGKSTLLNIVGLLETFDAGRVELFGTTAPAIRSRQARRLLRTRLAYLFQNYALVDNDTVSGNLRVAQEFSRGRGEAMRQEQARVLRQVGLDGAGDRRVYELSGGEQQRVAIARLLLKPCELVLADEPTGSLDADNRDRVLAMLAALGAAGKSIVIVTHDPVVADACTRVMHLPDPPPTPSAARHQAKGQVRGGDGLAPVPSSA